MGAVAGGDVGRLMGAARWPLSVAIAGPVLPSPTAEGPTGLRRARELTGCCHRRLLLRFQRRSARRLIDGLLVSVPHRLELSPHLLELCLECFRLVRRPEKGKRTGETILARMVNAYTPPLRRRAASAVASPQRWRVRATGGAWASGGARSQRAERLQMKGRRGTGTLDGDQGDRGRQAWSGAARGGRLRDERTCSSLYAPGVIAVNVDWLRGVGVSGART
jgi:hypothetical protein